MKWILAIAAAVVAFTAIAPAEAADQGRAYRAATTQKHYRYYTRPASVQANGLCQRDTGTSSSQLNFRNKCDTEEYFARVFERGRR